MNYTWQDHPVKNIWLRARETIEDALPYTKKKQVFVLIALFGVMIGLNQAAVKGLGDRMPLGGIVISSLIIGPLMGAFVWWILGGVFLWTGRLLGGQATWRETRGAFAWATIPYSAQLVLWVVQLPIFGHELFTDATPTIDNSIPLLALYVLFGLLEMALSIWFFVTLSQGLAAAHNFSSWLGFFSIILPVLIFFLLVLMLSVA